MGRKLQILACTRKTDSTTSEKTVSAIITEMELIIWGRPLEDRKAESAMSWNQMALTTLWRIH